MTRATVLLLSLAAVLATALVLELVSAPDPAEDLPPRPASSAAGDPAIAGAPAASNSRAGIDGPDDGLALPVQTILARPLFSPNRRLAARPDGFVGVAAANSLPRLAGVIVGPGGRRAIFALAGGGHPLVVAEGGRIGRYLVRAIVPGQVTLTDAEQQLVVRPSHAKGTPP